MGDRFPPAMRGANSMTGLPHEVTMDIFPNGANDSNTPKNKWQDGVFLVTWYSTNFSFFIDVCLRKRPRADGLGGLGLEADLLGQKQWPSHAAVRRSC